MRSFLLLIAVAGIFAGAQAGVAREEAAIFEVMFAMPKLVHQGTGGSRSGFAYKQYIKKVKEQNKAKELWLQFRKE